MKRDAAQLSSLAADPRYRYVRKWLFDHLAVLSSCAGAAAGWTSRPAAGDRDPAAPRGDQAAWREVASLWGALVQMGSNHGARIRPRRGTGQTG